MVAQLRTDRTKEVIAEMLVENTGRALCDSGDYYGRHWQQNQGRDFEAMPSSTVRAYVRNGELDLDITHNLYHWLSEHLEFAPDLDAKFQRFAERRPDDHWLAIMEEFGALMEKRGAGGIYGDGAPMTVNTYNGEDLLSQTIQYLYYELDGEAFVLLQIHGGCDVRGGYTRPRAFTVKSELGIFDNAKAVLFPEVPAIERAQLKLPGMESAPEAPYWMTDDGCHFYQEGNYGGRYHRLDEFPASEDPEDRGKGIVYVDEDHNLYCPLSGYRLSPSFF